MSRRNSYCEFETLITVITPIGTKTYSCHRGSSCSVAKKIADIHCSHLHKKGDSCRYKVKMVKRENRELIATFEKTYSNFGISEERYTSYSPKIGERRL